jgi:hypothetical protein
MSGLGTASIVEIAHVPEKWTPVFRKDMRQRKKLERIPIPSKRIAPET